MQQSVLSMLANTANKGSSNTAINLQNLLNLTKGQPVTTIFQNSDFTNKPGNPLGTEVYEKN